MERSEKVNSSILAIFDNGGKTIDRYSVYLKYDKNYKIFITMSENPTFPTGVFMTDLVKDVVKLGKTIKFNDLNKNCKKALVDWYNS